jgi:hypothetical protein
VFGGQQGTECVSVLQDQTVLIGDVITAPSAESITITGVRLFDSNGISVQHSYILPITDQGAIGSSAFPPKNSKGWDSRANATEAIMTANESRNLVLQLRKDSEGVARANAVAISYTADGRAFEKLGTTAYQLKTRCN